MADLEQAIAAAFDQHSGSPGGPSPETGDVAPPSEAPPAASNAGKDGSASEGERARDDKGRFAAKAEEKPAETPTKPIVAPQQQTQQPPQTPRIAPPTNWKGAGKTVWDKLPPAIQKELADDYAQRAKMETDSQQWAGVISPERAQAFAAQYGGTQQAIKQLLAISDYATKDPGGFVRWYAQQNRIDLTALNGQPAATGEQPSPPQDQHPLAREVVELRNTVQQMRQDAQQRQLDAVMAEVNAFKADPEHPYYNDVEQHIIALLPTIQGSTRERLQKAYDQAVWANPTVRESLLASERDKLIQQNAATVAQARKAAGINGSPAGAKVAGASEPRLTLEETVTRAVNSLQ